MKVKKFDLQSTLVDAFIKSTTKIDELINYLSYNDVCFRTLRFIVHKMRKIQNFQSVYDILTNIDPPECEKLFDRKNPETKRVSLLKIQNLYCKSWYSLLNKNSIPNQFKTECIMFLCQEGLDRMDDATILSGAIIDAFERDKDLAYVAIKGIYTLVMHSKIEYLGVYDRIIEVIDTCLFLSEYCPSFLEYLSYFMENTSISHEHARDIVMKLDLLLIFVDQKYQGAIVSIIVNCLKRRPSLESLYNNKNNGADDNQLCGVYILSELGDKGNVAVRICRELKFKLNNKVQGQSVADMINEETAKFDAALEKHNCALRNVKESNMKIPEELIETGLKDGFDDYAEYFDDYFMKLCGTGEQNSSDNENDDKMDDDEDQDDGSTSGVKTWLQTFRWCCTQATNHFKASLYWTELTNDIEDLTIKFILAKIALGDTDALLMTCVRILNFATSDDLCLCYRRYQFEDLTPAHMFPLSPVVTKETSALKSVGLVHHVLCSVLQVLLLHRQQCTEINIHLMRSLTSIITKLSHDSYPDFMMTQIEEIKALCSQRALEPVRAKRRFKMVEMLDPDLKEKVDPRKNVTNMLKKKIKVEKRSLKALYAKKKNEDIRSQTQKKLKDAAFRAQKVKEIMSSL